jgi:RHH-type proline utilization regulon transcriptional repressor/proline dehydrogenase/delta 1-pyrroline-5-carboxylate dehydrogenase
MPRIIGEAILFTQEIAMAWPHRTARMSPQVPVDNIEERTQQIGRELLTATRHAGAGTLSKKFWSDRLIAWALQDEAFKVQLFRFIDVFPVLKTPQAIHEHLVEYLHQPGVTLPTGMSIGLKAGGLFKNTLANTIASQVRAMAENFIAGNDVPAALPVLENRWRHNIAASVDLLGEACVSHAEAAAYAQRYLNLIDQLAAAADVWPAHPQLETDHLGPIPRANVSVKISALDGHVKPMDAFGSLDRLLAALAPLLEQARAKNVFINFDMEHHALKDLTIALFKRCCEQFDFSAGVALQAYLQSAEADAHDLIAWAKAKKRLVTVRLIKGAYWDYETIHAEMMNWSAPVWRHKHETDACFEHLAELFIRETPHAPGEPGIKLALGTHNTRSVAHAIAILEAAGLPQNAIEFQALRGMAEELKETLAARRWRVREYVPVGDMIPGMAYLVRRLLENTSNEGWLRAGQQDSISDEALLANPEREREGASVIAVTAHETKPLPDGRVSDGPHPFQNEPVRDFSSPIARDQFRTAVREADVPAIQNATTVEQAKSAIAIAAGAFPAWRDLPPKSRSAIILQAAAQLRARRDILAGVIIKESAKTWDEADGDVCEAIDFCEFYAHEAVELFTPRRLGRFTGELNEEFHQPRGVAAVISPWNFPLSICTGMTVAALVTGNTVVLKPAEQTPAIAVLLCEILWAAGVPKDALQFIPGPGETVGAAIVRDPRIALIAFTGSKAVGLDIIQAAAHTPPEQTWVKRVICEMGGKNAVIIDDSADLDEAVLAVRQSAFGYSGQKCSAASRVIVMDSIHGPFVSRLIESTRALIAGDPLEPATDLGPVIDDEAATKIRGYIEIGKQEATLALGSDCSELVRGKPLILPHIFTNVQPHHRLATEEIFGPVLSILRASDFPAALQIANHSSYKLTGGLFSRTPSHIQQARTEFRVGNLYLNRGITGALVGRQPFGGFALSGIGSKAGGRHYLLQFTDRRVVTENTMRRGFAPGS